jgi:hypothetical protein
MKSIFNSEISESIINKIIFNYEKENIENIKTCLIEMKNRNKRLNTNYTQLIIKHFKIESENELYAVKDSNQMISINDYLIKDSVRLVRFIFFSLFILSTLLITIIFDYIGANNHLTIILNKSFFVIDFLIISIFLFPLSKYYLNKISATKFGFIISICNFIIIFLITFLIYKFESQNYNSLKEYQSSKSEKVKDLEQFYLNAYTEVQRNEIEKKKAIQNVEKYSFGIFYILMKSAYSSFMLAISSSGDGLASQGYYGEISDYLRAFRTESEQFQTIDLNLSYDNLLDPQTYATRMGKIIGYNIPLIATYCLTLKTTISGVIELISLGLINSGEKYSTILSETVDPVKAQIESNFFRFNIMTIKPDKIVIPNYLLNEIMKDSETTNDKK